jgi:multidrug efflux system membrane fusion protein
MMKNKKAIGIIVIIIIVIVLFCIFIFKKKAPPPHAQRVPVLVDKAVQKTMPVLIDTIGSVEAYSSITVYSRVVGQLMKVHFKEGQEVRRGDPLFTIDPGSYREKLKNAEAKFAQDQAQLTFYTEEAKRYAYLMEKGAVSKSDYENKQTLARTQEAIAKSDVADVENAKLQLAYCFIASPIEGRTGGYLAHEGTMIKDNDTKLTIVNQIIPINVKFSVPEKQLPEIRKFMAKKSLKVKVFQQAMKENGAEGALSFIDNAVDPTTGMIALKAVFPNKDRFLWPGQFVNVVLELSVEADAVVVPARAVQISQGGSYVFVVKPDKTVEYRLVTAERTIGEETVIKKGVSPGEILITDGHLKLKDGFPVEIREDLILPKVNQDGGPKQPPPANAKSSTEEGNKK